MVVVFCVCKVIGWATPVCDCDSAKEVYTTIHTHTHTVTHTHTHTVTHTHTYIHTHSHTLM